MQVDVSGGNGRKNGWNAIVNRGGKVRVLVQGQENRKVTIFIATFLFCLQILAYKLPYVILQRKGSGTESGFLSLYWWICLNNDYSPETSCRKAFSSWNADRNGSALNVPVPTRRTIAFGNTTAIYKRQNPSAVCPPTASPKTKFTSAAVLRDRGELWRFLD